MSFCASRLAFATTGEGTTWTGWKAQCKLAAAAVVAARSAGITAARLHPLGQRRDGFGRQCCLGRHRELALAAHRLDQLALSGFTGHDDGLAVDPGLQVGRAIEPQAAALLLRPMAGVAVVGEDRPDLLFEEFDLRRIRLRGLKVRGREAKEDGEPPSHHRDSLQEEKARREGGQVRVL